MRWFSSFVAATVAVFTLRNNVVIAGDVATPVNMTRCANTQPGFQSIVDDPEADKCRLESGFSLVDAKTALDKPLANSICAVASCRRVYVLLWGLNMTDKKDCLLEHDIRLFRDVVYPLSTSLQCILDLKYNASSTSGDKIDESHSTVLKKSPPPPPKAPSSSSSSNTALIVGIVVGGVVAIALIVAGVYLVKSRRRRQENVDKLVDTPKNDGNDSPSTDEGTAPLTSPVILHKNRIPVPSAPTASMAYRPNPSAPTATQNSVYDPSAPTASLTQLPNPSAPTATQSVVDPVHSASLNTIATDKVLLARYMRAEDIDDVRVIGSGGHGIVYLVRYQQTHLLASKRLVQDRITTPKLLAFVDEIKLVSTLEHPCIVPFVGVAWTNESDLQALFEYMPNGDLCTHLAKTSQRATWDASKVQMALDVIHALVYVHSFSPALVHRDLKSRNVLLDANMRAKLSDFGVSRFQSDALTMTTGVGTSRWLAPEVINGGGTYDERCDVYSFGMVLVELDTHNLPFAGLRNAARNPMHEMTMLQLVSEGKLEPAFGPSCPPSILALARKCLAYDPTLRPSAMDVADALRKIAIDEYKLEPLC